MIEKSGHRNGANHNIERLETSRTFRRKRKCLKEVNEVERISNDKNIRDLHRGINEFEKVCQPRTYIISSETDNPNADYHNNLNTWKNYFCHLLNAHSFNDVTETELKISEYYNPDLVISK